MDCVLMGMIALLCYHEMRIVDRDNAVEQHDDHEQQQKQREVVQERVTHDSSTLQSARGPQCRSIRFGIHQPHSPPQDRAAAASLGFVLDGSYDRSEYGSASAAGNRL